MNDRISWDPSLVKKFSSSNYYKLLNQLRNEVKKYPLNNKKKISSNQSKDSNQDNINKTNESYSHNNPSFHKEKNSNEPNSNKTTVKFNNAKNFSIYNKLNSNINSNTIKGKYDSEIAKSNEDSSSKTS